MAKNCHLISGFLGTKMAVRDDRPKNQINLHTLLDKLHKKKANLFIIRG